MEIIRKRIRDEMKIEKNKIDLILKIMSLLMHLYSRTSQWNYYGNINHLRQRTLLNVMYGHTLHTTHL